MAPRAFPVKNVMKRVPDWHFIIRRYNKLCYSNIIRSYTEYYVIYTNWRPRNQLTREYFLLFRSSPVWMHWRVHARVTLLFIRIYTLALYLNYVVRTKVNITFSNKLCLYVYYSELYVSRNESNVCMYFQLIDVYRTTFGFKANGRFIILTCCNSLKHSQYIKKEKRLKTNNATSE